MGTAGGRPVDPYVEIDVAHGAGVVALCGSAAVSMLRLGGRPVALDAVDNEGSLGRIAARAGMDAPRPEQVQLLRDWLRNPVDVDEVPVAASILLELFVPGRYGVRLLPAQTVTVADVSGGEVDAWYPTDVALQLLPTDQWPPADLDTVEAYRAAIEAGERPAVVVLHASPDACAAYLLDGHHKVAAYEQAGRLVPLLEICRLGEAPALTRAELDEALERQPTTAAERALDRRVRSRFAPLRQLLAPDVD